jgi:hypothetical protein
MDVEGTFAIARTKALLHLSNGSKTSSATLQGKILLLS